MTPNESDPHPDLAATSVCLAAEAALLESRLTLLHEALDTVDTRIKTLTDTLTQIRTNTPHPTTHTLTTGIPRK
ncbi:hypothetical protein ACFWBV_31895 [Streptomyces sp. NPDC060030]|uniref:hypothetical protein n=1 Tax=Streptomyces sp. NPDC060030 TaxID=3347042 RepID=UPI0036B589D3